MTVAELQALLDKVEDKQRIVILQRDPEGNGYAPADLGVDDNAAWDQANGEQGKQHLTAADRKRGYTSDDLCKTGVPAVVLWPVF